MHYEGAFWIGNSEELELYSKVNNNSATGAFSGPDDEYFMAAGLKYLESGTAVKIDGQWTVGPSLEFDDFLKGYAFEIEYESSKSVAIITSKSNYDTFPAGQKLFPVSFDCDIKEFVSSKSYRRLLAGELQHIPYTAVLVDRQR